MSPRRVLITGASKGIGRAVADRLAAAGHTPVGLARTRPDDFPGEFFEVDLADCTATAEVLNKIVASGKIDAVVNNAGLARFARIGSIDLNDLFTTYDLNVRAAVQVVQAVLPGMRAAGWGRIVNVSSLTTLGVAERTSGGQRAHGQPHRQWRPHASQRPHHRRGREQDADTDHFAHDERSGTPCGQASFRNNC